MEESVDELSALLKQSSCEVIVSVDGFWSGKRLIRTKEIIDDAIANQENVSLWELLRLQYYHDTVLLG